MSVQGRTFPVEIEFARLKTKDYVLAAVEKVIQIHQFEAIEGDILVFLTGEEVSDFKFFGKCSNYFFTFRILNGLVPLLASGPSDWARLSENYVAFHYIRPCL